jgi:hypothetical protein
MVVAYLFICSGGSSSLALGLRSPSGSGFSAIVPLILYILFVLGFQRDFVGEILASGITAFLGYFAASMTMFGWPLLLIALVISLRGLAKSSHAALNAVTFGCRLTWFAGACWVLIHFR